MHSSMHSFILYYNACRPEKRERKKETSYSTCATGTSDVEKSLQKTENPEKELHSINIIERRGWYISFFN